MKKQKKAAEMLVKNLEKIAAEMRETDKEVIALRKKIEEKTGNTDRSDC